MRFFAFLLLFSANFSFAQPLLDVTSAQNLSLGYGNGAFGGGLSFCDFNGDGWDDLTFTTQNDRGIRFFINNEGTFQEIIPLVTNKAETKQVLWVDYDNDGDKDLFVTAVNAPNRLYRNEGDLNLVDVTETAGLGLVTRPTFGAAFGDFDNDGWLDLYVVTRSIEIYTNYLFRNLGNGTFQEFTSNVGVTDGSKPSFCPAFFDLNNNGRQDIYIAQDRYAYENTLFKNMGNGLYEDISTVSGADLAIDAMNVGIGDYDNDNDFDIYITNTAAGNKLLQNEGDETFTEVANICGLALYEVSWGANWFDYNNDGWLDLYVSTDQDTVSNPLYRNLGNGQFEVDTLHQNDYGRSYANAIGDFNRDGLPDLAANNAFGAPFRLWQNQVANPGNYIKVALEGTESNRDGIGSRIELSLGEEKLTRYTHCGIAYLAQNSEVETIGIGNATMIDTIKVFWLSGIVDTLLEVEANQLLNILEDSTNMPVSSTTNVKTEPGFELSSYLIEGSQLLLNMQLAKPMPINIECYDIAGRRLLGQQYFLGSGESQLQLRLPNLAHGLHILSISGEKSRTFTKIII